jgi:nitrous oxidase accessory protein NosD
MSYSLSKHKEGSALLISLIVLVLLSLASTVFVEKVWNFSKASTGIKDSTRAYYFSLATIEEGLMNPTVTKQSPWNVSGTAVTLPAPDNITKTLTVYTGGTSVPDIDK